MFKKIEKNSFFYGFAINTAIGIILFFACLYSIFFGQWMEAPIRFIFILFGGFFSFLLFCNFILNKHLLTRKK